jgi:putative transcriptional regulator
MSRNRKTRTSDLILGALNDVDYALKENRQKGLDGPASIGPFFSVENVSSRLKSLRDRLGLSQQDFASKFGLDVEALRNWEQSKRYPDKAARTLLTIIELNPDEVAKMKRAAEQLSQVQ